MKIFKLTWLLLSCFGISFALLSWGQDAGFGPEPGWSKGFEACVFGVVMYFLIARNVED